MKIHTLALVLGACTLTPALASAETAGARPIGFVTYETAEACAVSLEVTKSEGGLTDGTEKLRLGATLSYTFGGGGFDPSGKFSAGSRVLFGSPAFAKQAGATVDVEIPDADCATFNTQGGEIRFNGSLGKNPDLFKLEIPAAFGLQRGMNGDGTSIDLKVAAILLYGFTGSWTLGKGPVTSTPPGGATSDGGCSVSRVSRAGGAGGFFAVAALGLAFAARRRRHATVKGRR